MRPSLSDTPAVRVLALWLGVALCWLGVVSSGGAWAQQEDAAAEAPPPRVEVAAAPPADGWMGPLVDSVEEALRQARFRSALGIADQLRNHRGATPDQRARLELVRATAALALGDDEASQESFARLLAIDPRFELDDTHSPKLRRALERARRANP